MIGLINIAQLFPCFLEWYCMFTYQSCSLSWKHQVIIMNLIDWCYEECFVSIWSLRFFLHHKVLVFMGKLPSNLKFNTAGLFFVIHSHFPLENVDLIFLLKCTSWFVLAKLLSVTKSLRPFISWTHSQEKVSILVVKDVLLQILLKNTIH